ncbi:hypothetical protein SUGI_0768760 [Cryptomeria japonica]|nr:hypothetical protein SUGI_0768760 [Cryptomeria japonica]
MDKDRSGSSDNFTFSCFEYDDGPYIDMDFSTSPMEEDNKDSEEFEFNISISAGNKAQLVSEEIPNDVSPADELFYKGKLLPLHLPPRLQMVRNLSMSRESEADIYDYTSPVTLTSHESYDINCSFPSGSLDSNQEPISHKEAGIRSVKTGEHQSHSILKSATKFKVFLFGFRKSSKVGMDDHHSSDYSPPHPNHPRFTVKFKSMKTPVQFFTKNRSTKSQKSPDYSSRSPSPKHVLQKYLRMVKHIMSQRRVDSVDDQHLQVENEYGCPFIAGESGRVIHDSFSGNLKMGSRHLGFRSCPASMDSSPKHDGIQTSFYSDDHQSAVQAAIAHCKQSNGITDTDISKDSECSSQRFTSTPVNSTPAIEAAYDFYFPLVKQPEEYPYDK